MFELTRFEARRHYKQALGVSGGMFALVFVVMMVFPSFETVGEEYMDALESMPDALLATFGGGDIAITSLEGFLVLEVYQFVWMLVIGGYLAYASATLIAGERERGNIDVLLMAPIPRRQVVAEKFLSMIPDVILISLGTLFGVVVGAVVIDESIDLLWLVLVHVFSLPYLFACVAFGLVLSVAVESERRAQIVAFAGIAGMYVLEALVGQTDYDWLGNLMFARYLSPSDILVANETEPLDAAILVAMTVALLVLAAVLFERADITT
jgi:ABC-2 type transport system permease protein